MTWVIKECTGKCVTGVNGGIPEIAFVYRDPYCPLHGDAVADAETLRESLRWVRGELRKADAENNADRITDPWQKFMLAALRESTRDEALRILSTFALDDLFGLLYVETWIDTVIRERIRDYQNGVVRRHDAGQPDHD